MDKNKQNKSKLVSTIESLNRIGGSPKLDYVRQDLKYHRIWEKLKAFVNDNELYPDEIDKILWVTRSKMTAFGLKQYQQANPLCDKEDYAMDTSILTVYATLIRWLAEYDGYNRLTAFLDESLDSIGAIISVIENASNNEEITAGMSPADILNAKIERKPIDDIDVDHLLNEVVSLPRKEQGFVGITEAAQTFDEIDKQRRKWYYERAIALFPLISSKGMDFGNFKLSQEQVDYWKVRCPDWCVGEIWLSNCLDYWENLMLKK